MQKKILVAAVAGALASPLAFAQSSVTIYGTLDHSLHNYRISSSGATASISKWDVYYQSSRIGFRGEENLGGGMRAWFQAENGIGDGRQNNPNAFAFGSRNTAVGLTSGWGTVLLGLWDTPYKVSVGGITGMAVVGGLPGHNGPAIANGDSTGSNPALNCDNLNQAGGTVTGVGSAAPTTAVCGQVEGNGTSFHRRAANSVQYWSPKFGGFDFRVAFSANETKSSAAVSGFNNNPSLWGANGTYSAGPWYATVGYQQHRGFRDTAATSSTTNTKDKGWIIGGGYNFGAAALNLGYERLNYGNASSGPGGADNSFRRASWFVGGSVPLGPAGSALRAGYSRMSGNKNCGAGTTCGSATGLRVFTLGYGYALSKRSTAYVQYGKVTNQSLSAVTFNSSPTGPDGKSAAIAAGQDQTTLGVGLIHSF